MEQDHFSVKLTGPREGQTVNLNGTQFIKGQAAIRGEGTLLYLQRCYQVEVCDGQHNSEGSGSERQRPDLPGRGRVLQDGQGTTAPDPTVIAPADDSGSGAEGGIPDGDGHEHSRVYRSEEWKAELKESVKQISVQAKTHWTVDGRPKTKSIRDVFGGHVTKEDVDECFPPGTRAALSELQEGEE